MTQNCNQQNKVRYFITIYSREKCATIRLPQNFAGIFKCDFKKETLHTEDDFELELSSYKGKWYYKEKEKYFSLPATGDTVCLITKAGEKLLLIMKSFKMLNPGTRINLRKHPVVLIGENYENMIYFSNHRLISSMHAKIYKENGDIYLEALSEKAVYLNENRIMNKTKLLPGNYVELYGLLLVFTGELLVCSSFCGLLRAVNDEKSVPVLMSKGSPVKSKVCIVPRSVREEKAFQQMELDIKPPAFRKESTEPPFLLTAGSSITMVLPVLCSMLMSAAKAQDGSGTGFYSMTLYMTACTALLGLFWGSVNTIFNKRKRNKEEHNRQNTYLAYLERTDKLISTWYNENGEILRLKYPAASNFFVKEGLQKEPCYVRNSCQADFLFCRLGVGNQESGLKIRYKDTNGYDHDPLQEEAAKIAERYKVLKEMPCGINLQKEKILGFAGNNGSNGIHGVLLQLLLQIAATQNGRDIKIIYFYHKNQFFERQIAEYIKWLPHLYSENQTMRFLAGDNGEAGELLPKLTRELNSQQENERSNQGLNRPWYICIVANEALLQGEILWELLTKRDKQCRLNTIFLNSEKEQLPDFCQEIVICDHTFQGIQRWSGDHFENIPIKFDSCLPVDGEAFMRRLHSAMAQKDANTRMPEKVSFLKLYGCCLVEELKIAERWQMNRAGMRMKVPVGIGDGGRNLYLDLHEKFHGPHGLVAGTTGSGKSELLQTLLLSIAVNYSPAEVNFFIIDYKGGGMGNLLKSLPHCCGIISNLSGKQIKRAMSAIISENKRRQRRFSQAGVNHVDSYAKLYDRGEVKVPIPHLILVVDEFAELKKEEPDFMRDIISVAQVGRSLGVHLLLATQKPSGTIDDRIWSNTRFRLCLRVQDKQDSQDMLHKPEAALLKGAGQCYLQVGNDELYEKFQAAYSGADYPEPDDNCNRAVLLSDTGKRFTVPKRQDSLKRQITQIEAISSFLLKTVGEEGYKNAPPLWLPELPEILHIEQIKEEVKYEKFDILLGLCDDPENQRQFPVCYNPLKNGHLALCGGAASGKSTFLQTILYQLCRHENVGKVSFLIIDMRGRSLLCFENMPHCMGVLQKKEDAGRFFYHLKKLLKDREKLFEGGNFEQYCKGRKHEIPVIFLVIDDFAGFRQEINDLYEYIDFLEMLAAEGIRLGIYLLFTASGTGAGEIPGKIFEKIKFTAALEMSDQFKYGDILRKYQISVLPEENRKGRGILLKDGRVLEFQTVLALKASDDYERMQEIKNKADTLCRLINSEEGFLPIRFPVIPKNPTYFDLMKDFDYLNNRKAIPIGYDRLTGETCCLGFKQECRFLISGADKSGKKNFLYGIIKNLCRIGMRTVLIDVQNKFMDWRQDDKVTVITHLNLLCLEKKTEEQMCCSKMDDTVFCISSMADFCRLTLTEQYRDLVSFMKRVPYIIALHDTKQIKETAGVPFFEAFLSSQTGIHLGGYAGNQNNLRFDDLEYGTLNKKEPLGTGYLKAGKNEDTRILILPFCPQF